MGSYRDDDAPLASVDASGHSTYPARLTVYRKFFGTLQVGRLMGENSNDQADFQDNQGDDRAGHGTGDLPLPSPSALISLQE